MNRTFSSLTPTARVSMLKEEMLSEPRFMSVEQAKIITDVYRQNPKDQKQLLQKRWQLRITSTLQT